MSYIERVAPFVESNALLDDAGAIARRAAHDGYLFFRDLASKDVVAELHSGILAQCAQRGWSEEHTPTHNQLLGVQGAIQNLPAFSALRAARRIVSVLEMIFGAPVVARCGDVCRFAFPHDLERTTKPHQDHFYTRNSTSLWTVWIPLSDCPASLGGLAVLSGSHIAGLFDHAHGDEEARHVEIGDDVRWLSADFAAGDVLMFNALTIHGARPNVTARDVRISIDCRYRPQTSDDEHR